MAEVKEIRQPEFERHFTLAELSASWNVSVRTLRIWFQNEPVVRFGTDRLTKGKARTYVSVRVPESVARAVYARMTTRKIHRAG